VNPVTNKIYVANVSSNDVTVIDGATNGTTTVAVGSSPFGLAVNPVTNKIYVANHGNDTVTLIDGATNNTTTVPAGTRPRAVAVNPVTNKIYVANNGSSSVMVIDGTTGSTTTLPAGTGPYELTVNPVTNKIYVPNFGSDNMTVIDGATNATATLLTGATPCAAVVNPVTNKTYVANRGSDNVTVITDAPANDTKVRAAFNRLPGDTTVFARPPLTGKGVNRWTPGRTTMMGVVNRVGTTQMPWDWATVTSGAGTDSITWTYNWGSDSLIAGENFICCVPLEDQAATTNNLGLGTPFAGNLEVYPVYRMGYYVGAEEMTKSEVRMTKLPTIVRGVLVLEARGERREARSELLDITGRNVMRLKPGANDVSRLSPGVYFVRSESSAVAKVMVQR